MIHGPGAYARTGEADADPFPYLSDSPLTLLPPRERATVVLLTAGEDPAAVGSRVLGARRYARDRALSILTLAALTIHPTALPPRPPYATSLRSRLPDPLTRWALLLAASGSFQPRDQIATALRIDRATFYRAIHRATTTIARRVDNSPLLRVPHNTQYSH
jgi:hypothetical protein